MNIVLQQLVPGLTISVVDLGPIVSEEGNIGRLIQLMSLKNGKEIPFSYESEGIKKIVSILSGGNMDVITMSSVVQHGLIERGRVFSVAVLLPDKPGELLKVAQVIADAKGNVIKLEHNQFVSINRNAAVELRITLESFGLEHKEEIIEAMRNAGYAPKLIQTSF